MLLIGNTHNVAIAIIVTCNDSQHSGHALDTILMEKMPLYGQMLLNLLANKINVCMKMNCFL